MHAELLRAITTVQLSRTAPLLAALCVAALGCRESYVAETNNRIPLAVAHVIDPSGMSVDSSANAGFGPRFALQGSSVEVTLDGSKSSDADGKVVAWRWLNAGQGDEDAGRELAPGEMPGWPADEEKPKVKLTEGAWAFTLWVTDNVGNVSDPDTVKLIVGNSLQIDAGPPVVMCKGKACDPKVTLPGQTMASPACCDADNGDACGAVVDMTGACEAVDQLGVDDPSCPSEMSTAGTMIAGCCTPAKKCGVRSGVLRGCIERSDYPPGFLMSMMQLTAQDCGG